MTQVDTTARILDAAEQLFAEKGFSETSLRMITTRAKVNLAAVNYHFGSKKDLIQAVFARFLTPFTAKLEKELDAMAQAQKEPSFDDVLKVLVKTMLARANDEQGTKKLSIFMRLLGLAYTQAQGHLRKFISEQYANTSLRLIGYFKSAHPDLSSEAIFWRLHFAIGSAVFTMSSIETLRAMAERDAGNHTSLEQVVDYLVPFISAAMNQE